MLSQKLTKISNKAYNPYKMILYSDFKYYLQEGNKKDVTKDLQNVSRYITLLVRLLKKMKLHLFPDNKNRCRAQGG